MTHLFPPLSLHCTQKCVGLAQWSKRLHREQESRVRSPAPPHFKLWPYHVHIDLYCCLAFLEMPSSNPQPSRPSCWSIGHSNFNTRRHSAACPLHTPSEPLYNANGLALWSKRPHSKRQTRVRFPAQTYNIGPCYFLHSRHLTSSTGFWLTHTHIHTHTHTLQHRALYSCSPMYIFFIIFAMKMLNVFPSTVCFPAFLPRLTTSTGRLFSYYNAPYILSFIMPARPHFVHTSFIRNGTLRHTSRQLANAAPVIGFQPC